MSCVVNCKTLAGGRGGGEKGLNFGKTSKDSFSGDF